MRCFISLLFVILFSTFAFSQDKQKEKNELTEISVCSIEFLGIGKTLDWRFNFTYNFNTDKDGSVKDLKHIQTSKLMSSFLDQQKILDCIKGWKLKPQDKYQVEVITGNILVNTSFSISSKKETITYSYDTKTFEFSNFEKENNIKKDISICYPKLTQSGRQSSFRFNYRYIIQTDKEGLPKDLIYLGSKYNYESLADSSTVIPCIEKWKLSPSTKYSIYINIGTSGGPNSLNILSKDESIKIIL